LHQTHFEKIYTIFVCKSSAKNLVYDGGFVGVNERRPEEYLHVNGIIKPIVKMFLSKINSPR